MKLNRKLTQYRDGNPKAMATMSPAAIQFAFEDSKEDILTLARLLCQAAYPRRGTPEETMTMQRFAEKVQAVIPHSEAVEIA